MQTKRLDERDYSDIDELRKYLTKLKGKKFRLDCGHHVTFGHHLSNNLIIINGARIKIICSLCGY